MKKLAPVILVVFALFALIFSFSKLESKPTENTSQEIPQSNIPDDVDQMLQTSCYDCHIASASNLKAKTKLNFSKWEDYSDAKKVGKLENIIDEVTEGKMPPKRYLEKNPAAELDKEQIDAIVKWATDESNKLMGIED
jgi:hypothetical protein